MSHIGAFLVQFLQNFKCLWAVPCYQTVRPMIQIWPDLLVFPKFSVPLVEKLLWQAQKVIEVQPWYGSPLSPRQVWCGSAWHTIPSLPSLSFPFLSVSSHPSSSSPFLSLSTYPTLPSLESVGLLRPSCQLCINWQSLLKSFSYQWHSIAKWDGCFQQHLIVCGCVCLSTQ